MGMFVNNLRGIGQCRVIIIIIIIIIITLLQEPIGYGLLIIAMKSGAPFLGLAKYIYITLHVITTVFIHWNSPVFILLADTFIANLFHVRIYNLLIHCNSYLFDL